MVAILGDEEVFEFFFVGGRLGQGFFEEGDWEGFFDFGDFECGGLDEVCEEPGDSEVGDEGEPHERRPGEGGEADRLFVRVRLVHGRG